MLVFLLWLAGVVGAVAERKTTFVRCETTAGDFTVSLHKDWAPLGYARFMELVNDNFFEDQIIYRYGHEP
jgi:hypothetical protein